MKNQHEIFHPIIYKFLCSLCRVALRICHPVIHIEGRENLPQGAAVLCANHSHLTDPIWVIVWARLKGYPRIMAKKELFCNGLFRWFFTKVGAFPVDRSNADVKAIKTALQTLKEDNKLLIFPEGTRVRKGKASEPHSGAVLLAHRINAPIVPVYLSVKKGLFRPIHLKFGKPYLATFDCPKPDSAALEEHSVQLMKEIYAMGEPK